MEILVKGQQRYRRLSRIKIKKIARQILSLLEQPTAELSILFVGDKKMKELNTVFRNLPTTTDVLSFPQTSYFPFPTSHLLLGDVVINIPQAERQAKIHGLSFYDEVCRLLIHGILHLLGYNHEKSSHKAKLMREKEREVFNAVKKIF